MIFIPHERGIWEDISLVNLSLQVKKFINSEHTGRYVDVTLPNELALETRGKEKDGAPEEPSYETMRLHYVEEGTGEPLILLHTVGQSLYTWRNIMPRLSAHYRVIALDLPGHGYSDRPISFEYSIEDYGEILRLFLDAMNIKSAHFLAFSMSCAYVIQFALEHPNRIGRLILESPGGVTNEMPMVVKLIDSTIFGPVACMLYTKSTVQKLLEDCFFDLTFVKPDMVQEYYKPASDPEGRKAIRASVHFFDDEPLLGRLREMEKPVLMLRGSEDKWHGPEFSELLHSILPDAGFAIIRNAGHVVHEEKPERIIDAVLEFIPVVMPDGPQ